MLTLYIRVPLTNIIYVLINTNKLKTWTLMNINNINKVSKIHIVIFMINQ